MRRLIALAVAGLLLLVLIVAQLVLPGIAEQRIRDQLSRSGTVVLVSISAFPAIKLLWHHADRVVVRLGRYRSGASDLGDSLARTAGVGTLDASAQEVQSGALVLHDATLLKRGSELTGTATVMNVDLRSAVPFLDKVEPVESSGERLVLRGSASLLGLTATVDAIVAASNGDLVVAPDVPLGGIATITLFHDPRVQVQSVNAVSVPGGFTLTARGHLP